VSDCIRCNRKAYFCAEHMNSALHEKQAVIDDLKSRLRQVRSRSRSVPQWHLFEKTTDLRVKKWRKP